ncbi:MAG: ABC transporter permease [Gemmatimonadales bacterium]
MSERPKRDELELPDRPRPVQDEVDDELTFHVDAQIEDLVRQGHSRRAAEAEARRRFGNLGAHRDRLLRLDARNRLRVRRLGWLADLGRDLRYALRGLRRSPGFVLGVVTILGLGIGANVAIFRLIDATLLNPVPGVRAPGELHELTVTSLPYPRVERFARELAGLEVAGYRVRTLAVSAGAQAARPEQVALVTGGYFSTLGATPALGRALGPGDDAAQTAAVAVVSHDYWRRALGGRADVLGQSIRVSGSPLTVVGVAEPRFRGLRVFETPEVWVPAHAWPLVRPSSMARLDIDREGWGWMTAFGRLQPGVAVERVSQAAQRINAEADEAAGVPDRFRQTIVLRPAAGAAIGGGTEELPRVFALLMGAVGLLLLLASANVATLLLARSHGRLRELAVRSALGGGRGRLVRMLLAEAVVLGGLAALVGLLVYRGVADLLAAVALPGGVRLGAAGLGTNGASLFALAAVAAVTAFLIGLAPSLRVTARALSASAFGLAQRGTVRRSRLRATLVAVQVGIAVVLLLGAALFGRGLGRALSIDQGFDSSSLSAVSVELGLARYQPERALVLLRQIERETHALPGVTSASWVLTAPLVEGDGGEVETFSIQGHEADPSGNPTVEVNLVTEGFWRTFGLEPASGRLTEQRDGAVGSAVAVVSDAFVSRFLPGEAPLAAQVVFGGSSAVPIVGVVPSITYHELGEAPRPVVYLPLGEAAGGTLLGRLTLVVRGGGPQVATAVVDRIKDLDPAVAANELGPYPRLTARLLLPQRLGFGLLLSFGALAVVVAGIGVFSMMSNMVVARTQEFGVRSALGASRRSLLALALRDQVMPVAVGLVVGVAAGIALGRLASGLLYGVPATDPRALATAIAGLGVVAALAALYPAWKGSRLDPVAAIRSE